MAIDAFNTAFHRHLIHIIHLFAKAQTRFLRENNRSRDCSRFKKRAINARFNQVIHDYAKAQTRLTVLLGARIGWVYWLGKHRRGGLRMTNDRNDSQDSTGWLTGRQITTAEMKVGQLLVEAAIISPATLDAAIKIAAGSHQALETVLQNQFHLTHTLKNLDKASEMIDAQLVERSAALEALLTAHASSLDFTDVIAQNNGGLPELEHLLIQSKMVSAGQLKEAKRIGKERGLQIAASLFFMKVVSFTHLNYALDCLYLVKENRLSMGRAVIALAEVKLTNVNLRTALGEVSNGPANHVKIGELLLSGRVVSEAEMLRSLEEAIVRQRLIGTLLVESGLVSESTLKDVLLLQNFCSRGVLDQRSAVKILRKSMESSEELKVAACSMNAFCDDGSISELALEALLKAGFVNAKEIAQAQLRFDYLQMGPLRALVADGRICASARRAALECAQLRLANVITEDEAVNVLHYCDRHSVGYEEAFSKLGISKLEDRRRNVDLTISNEFKKNKSLVPKLHKSFHFFLMMMVFIITIVSATVLRNFDPGNVSIHGVILLSLTASAVIFRIAKFWLVSYKQQLKDNEVRMETARVTVGRLKPQINDDKRQPRRKVQISEDTGVSRV